nr:hypothetical membrane protein [uncultured archaeon]
MYVKGVSEVLRSRIWAKALATARYALLGGVAIFPISKHLPKYVIHIFFCFPFLVCIIFILHRLLQNSKH